MNYSDFVNLATKLTAEFDTEPYMPSVASAYKACSDAGRDETERYLTTLMPDRNGYLLQEMLATIENRRTDAYSAAVLLCKRMKMDIRETICGVEVTAEDRDTLVHIFLLMPLRDDFDQLASEFGIDNTPAEFEKFRRFVHGDYVTYNRHPIRTEKYYWTSDDVRNAGICDFAKQCTRNNLTVEYVAGMFGVQAYEIRNWVEANPETMRIRDRNLIVEPQILENALINYQNLVDVKDVIKSVLKRNGLSTDGKRIDDVISDIEKRNALKSFLQDGTSIPGAKSGSRISSLELKAAEKIIEPIVASSDTILLRDFGKQRGLNINTLRSRANSGCIKAAKYGNELYISLAEAKRIQSLLDAYTPVNDIVEKCINDMSNTLFVTDDPECQRAFRKKMKTECANRAWVETIDASKYPGDLGPYNCAVSNKWVDNNEFLYSMKLFLLTYRRTHAEAFTALLQEFHTTLPDTVQHLKHYAEKMETISLAVRRMSAVVLGFGKEVCTVTGQELKDLCASFLYESDDAQWHLSKFLRGIPMTSDVSSVEMYLDLPIDSENKRQTKEAYPYEDYLKMVATTVNRNVWTELGLIEKAVADPKFATMWLHISILFFCLVRDSDIRRLVPPELPVSAEAFLNRIGKNRVDSEMLRDITTQFIELNNQVAMTPQKTASVSLVPHLQWHIPDSVYEDFGIILGIATAHHIIGGGKQFINCRIDLKAMRDFYGEDFYKACDRRVVSRLRLNKNLAQLYSDTAVNELGLSPVIGYELISLARSHKSGYMNLSASTVAYLRCSTINGMTINEVVFQLMERGTASWYIDIFLNKVYGEEYSALLPANKTQIIKLLGVDAYHLNSLVTVVDAAMTNASIAARYREAEKTVSDLFIDKDAMQSGLVRIMNGIGKSKDTYGYCLCHVADKQCPYPGCNCLFCKYEIATKYSFMTVAKQYWELTNKRRLAETKRDTAIIEILGRKLLEYREYIKGHASEEGIAEYKGILRGIRENGYR